MIGALAVIVAALLGIVAASCGVGRGGAESAGPVPTAAPGGEVAGTSAGTTSVVSEGGSSTSSGTLTVVTYEVWFTRGESLFMVRRDEPSTPRIATAAMQSLLAGPSAREQAAAVGSQIPAGTQLLGLTIEDGVATVDLTSEFESGGGSASMNMRIAQVVYTLTQFPTVKGVLFELDGQRVDVLGGEGVVVDEPVTRKDYRDLLPAILVVDPQIGVRVHNPVVVQGSANVFEANVSRGRRRRERQSRRQRFHDRHVRDRLPRNLFRPGPVRGHVSNAWSNHRSRRRCGGNRNTPARGPDTGRSDAVFVI